METVEKITRPVRKFLPEDFKVTTWESLESFFNELLNRSIGSPDELKQWFSDRSELESVISEDLAWRYIRMTCYTENKEYLQAYQDFIQHIQPKISPVVDALNKKAAASPYLPELERLTGFDIMIRNLKKEIEIFREQNVPLFTEISGRGCTTTFAMAACELKQPLAPVPNTE